jgi:hypothetical protein
MIAYSLFREATQKQNCAAQQALVCRAPSFFLMSRMPGGFSSPGSGVMKTQTNNLRETP